MKKKKFKSLLKGNKEFKQFNIVEKKNNKDSIFKVIFNLNVEIKWEMTQQSEKD